MPYSPSWTASTSTAAPPPRSATPSRDGKPILGYRGDLRLAADNEGASVNLQVEYFIRQSGGDIVTSLADALALIETWGKGPALRRAGPRIWAPSGEIRLLCRLT